MKRFIAFMLTFSLFSVTHLSAANFGLSLVMLQEVESKLNNPPPATEEIPGVNGVVTTVNREYLGDKEIPITAESYSGPAADINWSNQGIYQDRMYIYNKTYNGQGAGITIVYFGKTVSEYRVQKTHRVVNKDAYVSYRTMNSGLWSGIGTGLTLGAAVGISLGVIKKANPYCFLIGLGSGLGAALITGIPTKMLVSSIAANRAGHMPEVWKDDPIVEQYVKKYHR